MNVERLSSCSDLQKKKSNPKVKFTLSFIKKMHVQVPDYLPIFSSPVGRL